MNANKITLNDSMIGSTCAVTGTITFARLTRFAEGEEVTRENERRKKVNPKMPLANGPFCTITLEDAEVCDRGYGNYPTEFEKYVGDKCYQRGSDGKSMFNYEIKARLKDGKYIKILPRVYTDKGTIIQGIVNGENYKLPGEPEAGTKCKLEFECVKTQHQYPAFVLRNVILYEPVKYRNSVPVPEDFVARGIRAVTLDEHAVKVDGNENPTTENTNAETANDALPYVEDTVTPFANAQPNTTPGVNPAMQPQMPQQGVQVQPNVYGNNIGIPGQNMQNVTPNVGITPPDPSAN